MFRNPRENRALPRVTQLTPSTGRPSSPPHPSPPTAHMAAKPVSKKAAPKPKTTPAKPAKTQTTLVPTEWAKKSANNGFKSRPKATPNGNIMAFFKKAEEINNRIFLQEKGTNPTLSFGEDEQDLGWSDEMKDRVIDVDNAEERYNENGGSIKKRKLGDELSAPAGSPPPPEVPDASKDASPKAPPVDAAGQSIKPSKKTGPFVDDSDSEADDDPSLPRRGTILLSKRTKEDVDSKPLEESTFADRPDPTEAVPPLLRTETTSQFEGDDFDDFEGLEDDDLMEGEEYDERRWMKEQQRLEMAEAGFDGDPDDFDAPSLFPEESDDMETTSGESTSETPSCPICSANLPGLTEQEISAHVNACLDGNPLPVPKPPELKREGTPGASSHKMFKRPPRPARPAQDIPFNVGESSNAPKSAFSKLMSNHAEDAAWATAAAAESAAKGKPSYQRTCPFYKIMPGFFICVDAFRYGAVKGQNAYFLSHFHSDHYIGLTASWSHGPIYCSKVTGNLVRQQLQVDPKWVVDLDFEKKTEVPGTQGVSVTMISANHCPGSSLFLFDKEIGKEKTSKLQRVLHCGDFRACQAHLEHPLLKPEVMDAMSGKSRQQKLDVCYLDTTYLNPKYAFPPQQQVIQACADMCVSLNKEKVDEKDCWEQMKRERAGEGMVKFVQKAAEAAEVKTEDDGDKVITMGINRPSPNKGRGRLLVVVGTYSIGKERICMGIAKALNSKIYAPTSKQRICRALEDPELDALLTKDPREAQVHMTPLFEIRADTLDDYLREYGDHFSRAVGFRPSGWNYRPPKSRFTDSPPVQTVLHSQNWKSQFTMRDLTEQRGSTYRAKCFGVPYSEHSSFRELTMFCCALRIDKIVPTVNVGNAKSREKMKAWCERWAVDKRKNGLFRFGEGGAPW
ncbi:DNA cross-link repair protein pso2/snm1 [Lentithecium fluviatile CBS 122367]|uniref:DNA cross-link repair protein pso2/snm1 n=1 Tax=Lentithecium fluviatile CBS 122367 TaxID=1168545 RepID=A0A6G1IVD9_9PLEO|nr:DNA cross-link repair protein pso2/snm1 [Lentithecium fluviatile CBS 122367]